VEVQFPRIVTYRWGGGATEAKVMEANASKSTRDRFDAYPSYA